MPTHDQLDQKRRQMELYRQTFAAYARIPKGQTTPHASGLASNDIPQHLMVHKKEKQTKDEHVKKEEEGTSRTTSKKKQKK